MIDPSILVRAAEMAAAAQFRADLDPAGIRIRGMSGATPIRPYRIIPFASATEEAIAVAINAIQAELAEAPGARAI